MSNSSNHIISGASVTNNSIGSEIQSSSSEETIISCPPGDDTLYINRGVVVTNLSNVYITSGMSVNSLNISSAAMLIALRLQMVFSIFMVELLQIFLC